MQNPKSKFQTIKDSKESMTNANTHDLERALIDLLTKLVGYYDDFTNYRPRDVMPINLLKQKKSFKLILDNLPKIRKYQRGEFKKEVMSTIKDIVKVVGEFGSRDVDDEGGFFSRLIRRS